MLSHNPLSKFHMGSQHSQPSHGITPTSDPQDFKLEKQNPGSGSWSQKVNVDGQTEYEVQVSGPVQGAGMSDATCM